MILGNITYFCFSRTATEDPSIYFEPNNPVDVLITMFLLPSQQKQIAKELGLDFETFKEFYNTLLVLLPKRPRHMPLIRFTWNSKPFEGKNLYSAQPNRDGQPAFFYQAYCVNEVNNQCVISPYTAELGLKVKQQVLSLLYWTYAFITGLYLDGPIRDRNIDTHLKKFQTIGNGRIKAIRAALEYFQDNKEAILADTLPDVHYEPDGTPILD